jgi:hypothetical protein|tara:strand:- start:690 stop:977 length:288 start_codon:yes stop_codon:yes gene_type:complete
MNWLITLTLKSILGSIIGSSFYAWFKNTKVGVWVQKRVDRLMAWVAHRYHIEILAKEDKWLQQYPLLAKRIVDLESGLKILQNDSQNTKRSKLKE